MRLALVIVISFHGRCHGAGQIVTLPDNANSDMKFSTASNTVAAGHLGKHSGELTRAADEDPCPFQTKAWEDYCNSATYPKSFFVRRSATKDCPVYWWQGGDDARQSAWAACNKTVTSPYLACILVDDNGAKCHNVILPLTGFPNNGWANYCKAPLPKKWAMTFAGDFAWYFSGTDNDPTPTCTEKSKNASWPAWSKQDCHIFDVNGGKCASTCTQYQPDWCWATAAAEIASRIDYSLNQESHDCTGLECQVSGVQLHPSNPQQCCTDKQTCGEHGGTNADIVKGIEYLVKRTLNVRYLQVPSGQEPLSEQDLKSALNKGYSISMGIQWSEGDKHSLSLMGTDNNGNYYVHDSYNDDHSYGGLFDNTGKYQHLRYSQLLRYSPPYNWFALQPATSYDNSHWIDGVIVEEGGHLMNGNLTAAKPSEGGGFRTIGSSVEPATLVV